MRAPWTFDDRIALGGAGRIPAEDAARQERSAREILRRFADQPGVILADEVGMGKTFVALAVAMSVAESDPGRRPVVVMVPPSLQEKWPADFALFRERCLPPEIAAKLRVGRANTAEKFLKLLDDPPEKQRSIIFVTHGAMSRGLNDGWVKLALVARALRGRWGAADLRARIARWAPSLLWLKWVAPDGDPLWEDLLDAPATDWLDILHRHGKDPEGDRDPDTDDDPIPRAVIDQFAGLDLDPLYRALQTVPERASANLDARLKEVREVIHKELRPVWVQCVQSLRLRMPLLVLDEAHHLKNEKTQLASLFQNAEAEDDAAEIAKGALGGAFERMLFLTATPFQLGHAELCSVLDRFDGIAWDGENAPSVGREEYEERIAGLRSALDQAQCAAIGLDASWGRLKTDDLAVGDRRFADSAAWWAALDGTDDGLSSAAGAVRRHYGMTSEKMRAAEALLRPWVIRHLKPRALPGVFAAVPRRLRYTGAAILDESPATVAGESLLPFLLAARATTDAPESRPVFAEGLASSWEAFLDTRLRNRDHIADDDVIEIKDDDGSWYLDRLAEMVPRDDAEASAAHPKVAATVKRAVEIWGAGEKALVFCHYIATGRTLHRHIAAAIQEEIRRLGYRKFGCSMDEVDEVLARIGERFFDVDSPVRRACDRQTDGVLDQYPALDPQREPIREIVRRNARTPAFLVRFFPLRDRRLDEEDMVAAMDRADRSGMTLRVLLSGFLAFLVERCGEADRDRYIDAVRRIQLGGTGDEAAEDERAPRMPNVRLVNGAVVGETRQRLMLAFNTPFAPEVLVASSVMAEGVDLHLACRHVIHHDLCWNPSTLEQRTGRIDRIGAKAERCGRSIAVYLPFIAETQDEKMYRVVMDRERWFSVVMGERYAVDARTTDRFAARVPFPEDAARALAFRLEVGED